MRLPWNRVVLHTRHAFRSDPSLAGIPLGALTPPDRHLRLGAPARVERREIMANTNFDWNEEDTYWRQNYRNRPYGDP